MEKSVKSTAITQGLILGVILSLITVIGYVAYQDIFTQWWLLLVLLGITITIGIISAIKSRKLLGGYISYKSAFTSYFLTIVIGTLISMVVGILIFTVIDTGAAESIKERSIEVTVQMMERFGAPQETIDETITKMEEQNTFGVATQLKNWAGGMVFYIIVGLLACLAIRKNEPLY
ncbi:DUF4199 domain-containing protein [Aquimarina sp. RZ0]|uniref:DUF4199 domain-containing protein n=1 Tax=Aquimarina sp. RZ0 TaxID=2607730 RepID=UPI0011F30BF5|nr:DUF4199 domain-containing protein [Aquimarina sp. RZ0]KAA1244155.1 DUF4199 domain-containing protein [Aquimarina sp. RZ0]